LVNIPPHAESENGVTARAVRTLAAAVALCAMLTSCRLEFAAETGSFAPSVGEVRTLLDQDRVRQAMQRSTLLTQRYRGAEAELVHGWALWRNGDARGAETNFRRAAKAGLAEGDAGLAALRASESDWGAATELARSALAADRTGSAHAVLASAAWVAGDVPRAAVEMQAWSVAEAGTSRGHAAAATAAAISRLTGPPHQWVGQLVRLPLQRVPGGGWAVEVSSGGQRALLKLDLTLRQSLISDELADELGLTVEGPATPAGRAASARWPALLSPRQAALGSIEFNTLELRNIVVAVASAPEGVDGVLGADVLTGARWSLSFAGAELALAPPSADRAALSAGLEGEPVAWLKARLVREGIGVQMLFFPRVSGVVVAAGLDIGGNSRLDSASFVVPPGSNSAPADLMLGGWEGEVRWRAASLTGWAVDGGVAPTAVVGASLLEEWTLHWYPNTMQLRIDDAVSPRGVTPAR